MLNAKDIEALLANATPDTIVHIDYLTGNPPNAIGRKEYAEAKDWGKAPTEYTGNFASLKRNKFGELVLTLFCHNRGKLGSYRSFNPNLGTVRAIHVVQPS
jgi:hypothetical protein